MRRLAPWAAGAAVAVAVAVATAASRRAHPAEVSPVVPHGGWNAVWVAALVAGFAVYAASVVLLDRLRTAAWLAALVVAVVVQALPLASPLLLSKDVFLYWAEARIVLVHHASPYRVTPSAFPDDPATQRTSEEWLRSKAPYGPVWEALALAPGAAAGGSARHAVSAYRVFSFLGVVATVVLVGVATRRAATVALLGWNPLVALHYGGGGHSDGWLVALLVGAVIARRRAAGGVAWSLAAAFKPVGAILVPLDLAANRFARPPRFWLGLVVAAFAILVASIAAWGTGWIRSSLVGVHGASPLGGVHWLTEAGLTHHNAVAVGALVFALVYVVLFVRAWRGGRAHLGLAAAALCLTTSLLRPWYAIWPLALAAVEDDAPGAAAAIGLSAYLLFGDAVQF